MIHVGTSGFGYADWVGVFYPPGLPARERLGFYANEFSTVEINFSYYRLPTARGLEAISDKAPEGMLFCIKAHGSLTHQREDLAANCRAFVEALAPWRQRGCLGTVLAQFPHSFHNTPENRDYLRALADEMGDVPTVVEFRHAGWARRSVLAYLRELRLGVCCVDQPHLPGLMPAFAVVTAPVGYVRFHGRNAAKWWRHQYAWQRYDYSYTKEELDPWVPRIQEMAEQAETVFVFANNHWQGQAVDTARQLKMSLGL